MKTLPRVHNPVRHYEYNMYLNASLTLGNPAEGLQANQPVAIAAEGSRPRHALIPASTPEPTPELAHERPTHTRKLVAPPSSNVQNKATHGRGGGKKGAKAGNGKGKEKAIAEDDEE